MQQIAPGIFHWTAFNEAIGARVSSAFIASAAAVIDPKIPEEGLDALPGRPERVLLTSGHHLRDATAFADRFEIPILASPQAAAHIGSAATVEAWSEGTTEVAPGITAIHLGVLAADEGALHIAAGDGVLALADAVNHSGEALEFFPDALLGDDPAGVRSGLRSALAALTDSYAFDAVLFAHGEPLQSGGADALRAFCARQ